MHSLPDIRAGLDAARREVSAYFGGLTAETLFRREPGEWSPMDDLRHLTRSTVPVAKALTLPRLLLRMRFGRADRPSRSYDDLREAYRSGLAGGVKAPPRFVPPDAEVGDAERYLVERLARWESVNDQLADAIGRWDERGLDRYVLPHPALGDLTVREMLFFTHFHGLHHVEVAKRRVARAVG